MRFAIHQEDKQQMSFVIFVNRYINKKNIGRLTCLLAHNIIFHYFERTLHFVLENSSRTNTKTTRDGLDVDVVGCGRHRYLHDDLPAEQI